MTRPARGNSTHPKPWLIALLVVFTSSLFGARTEAQTYNVLHAFSGPDGAAPYAGSHRGRRG